MYIKKHVHSYTCAYIHTDLHTQTYIDTYVHWYVLHAKTKRKCTSKAIRYYTYWFYSLYTPCHILTQAFSLNWQIIIANYSLVFIYLFICFVSFIFYLRLFIIPILITKLCCDRPNGQPVVWKVPVTMISPFMGHILTYPQNIPTSEKLSSEIRLMQLGG